MLSKGLGPPIPVALTTTKFAISKIAVVRRILRVIAKNISKSIAVVAKELLSTIVKPLVENFAFAV